MRLIFRALSGCRKSRRKGFTLLELAVVLFILTLLAGRFLMPLAAQREARQWQQAETEIEEMKRALLGYAVLHGALPCPDSDGNGFAKASCATETEGRIPYKTLGLTSGNDPWGRVWRYRVERRFADAAVPIRFDTSFATPPIHINNLQGTSLTSDSEPPVFILMSAGANGRFERDNAIASSPQYLSDRPTPDFDDIVFWVSRPTLFHHLLMAGRIN